MFLRKEAIESISKKLELEFTGIEQDWEIEFADSKRLNEFIEYYLENNNLGQDEKLVLMALIMASYDDYLNEQQKEREEFWKVIKKLVSSESIFNGLIKYWSVENENDPEMLYKITPFVRELKP